LLNYEIAGREAGLVLVHGTASNGQVWGLTLDQFAARHTVVVPDLPGSGGSPRADGPLHLDMVADEIAAATEDAGLDSFAVVGMSMGAGVAVRMATRYPARVSRLALLAGYAYPRTGLRLRFDVWTSLLNDDQAAAKLLVLLGSRESTLAEMNGNLLDGVLAMVRAGWGPGAAAQLELARGLDVRRDLSTITVPTLVMAGSSDAFVDIAHSVELARGILGSRMITVDGGGHGFIFEQPGALRTLLSFLDEARTETTH
jgi:pimeloyl-ACP methyl ester carboxylesterase